MSQELEYYTAFPWTPVPERVVGGRGFRLTVQELDDFEIFAATKKQVMEEWQTALRSHLQGYLAVGKVVPVPQFRVVSPPQASPQMGHTQQLRMDHLGWAIQVHDQTGVE